MKVKEEAVMAGSGGDDLIRALETRQAELRDLHAAAEAAGEHAQVALGRAEAVEAEFRTRTWTVEIAPGLGAVVVDGRGYLVDVSLDRSVRSSDTSRLGERILSAVSEARTQMDDEWRRACAQIFAYVGE